MTNVFQAESGCSLEIPKKNVGVQRAALSRNVNKGGERREHRPAKHSKMSAAA